MRERHRRAWMHTRSPDFLHTILPAITLAVATAAATCYTLRDNEDFEAGDVIVPTLVGLAVFLLVLAGIHGGEYVLRFLTGRAPKGTPRTLLGLDRGQLRAMLTPSGTVEVSRFGASSEAEHFAQEIEDLFRDCGWTVQRSSVAYVSPNLLRDVEIKLPEENYAGLEAFGKRLNAIGYRTVLRNGGAVVTIGDRSRDEM